ncbi:MAG: YifB family Mg chelatase-like AAA ATPase [Spirochaetes bacterium]|nr:YifB family Mg chelatase-like AAA ATPase [Spirochaetota bacterium]
MLGKTFTFSRIGMNCHEVEVEVDLKKGLPGIVITGLLSQEVKESKDRIRPAIQNSGFEFPVKKITINLGPAEAVKSGTHYDLAIAAAILQASGRLEDEDMKYCYFGELNLSGEIKWVRGILPLVVEAIQRGYQKILVPEKNLNELVYLNNSSIIPVKRISDLFLSQPSNLIDYQQAGKKTYQYKKEYDYSHISGQENLIKSFQIAAAGNHHMLIVGPPGSGKTMAASRLPSIMPELTDEEILEINMIYSILSQTEDKRWLTGRPFRTPHNTASYRALIGGGPKLLPGEVSLAHKGILFLDEFLEFKSDTLQALRTVIEKKEAYISLRNGFACYPADFLLIAAANPCPCGYYDTDNGVCSCALREIKHYRRKLRNPLTDRIDIQVKIDRVAYQELSSAGNRLSSKMLAENVKKAREFQAFRYEQDNIYLNAAIPPEKINDYCQIDNGGKKILEKFVDNNLLTARSYHKILKVARTIADLAGAEKINSAHLREALELRFI